MEEQKLTITTGLALTPQFQQAFVRLLNQTLGLDLAYWLQRIAKVLAKAIPEAEKAREAILKPLNGGPLTEDARKVMTHLFDQPIELPITRKVLLWTNSTVALSAADLIALEPILEVSEPVQTA